MACRGRDGGVGGRDAGRPAALGEPKDLYVVVVADAGETADGQALPMASILFVKGQPTTRITVHAGHVARRLAGMRFDDLPFAERPRPIRDRVLGRCWAGPWPTRSAIPCPARASTSPPA